MDQFQIQINGEPWTVRWSRSVRYRGVDCWGITEHNLKRIRLHRCLKLPRNRKLLEDTLTHEIMHAGDPKASERKVRKTTAHILRGLWHPEIRGHK